MEKRINFDKNWFTYGLSNGIALTLASIVRAISVYTFTVPNKFAPGGVTGISSILYNQFGWNISLVILLLNIPLMVLAFLYINKKFAVKTAIEIVLISLFIELLTRVDFPVYVEEPMLAAVFGGVLSGVALAAVFKVNASTGGSDIVGMLIQKKFTATNVAWFILAIDSVVVLAGGIIFKNITPVLYSYVALFIGSKTTEAIMNGFSSAITFNVITKKPEEVSAKIISTLHRGVSQIRSVGAYTKEENTLLICVVRKRQVTAFHQVLKETDPQAFAFAVSAREVLGKGFTE